MYIAMRGPERIVEGDDLDQVVIAAEEFARPGAGDIVVWQDGKYIAAEIENDPDMDEPITTYRHIDELKRLVERHL